MHEENPHLVFGNIAVVRKMGFPEVILPGDVRNDLYLTLVNGEFSKGTKSSDKNIEVVVTVCNEKGVPLQVFFVIVFIFYLNKRKTDISTHRCFFLLGWYYIRFGYRTAD